MLFANESIKICLNDRGDNNFLLYEGVIPEKEGINSEVENAIISILDKIQKAKKIGIGKVEKACVDDGEYTIEYKEKKYEIQNEFWMYENTSSKYYRINILQELRTIRDLVINDIGINRLFSILESYKEAFDSVKMNGDYEEYPGFQLDYNQNKVLVEQYFILMKNIFNNNIKSMNIDDKVGIIKSTYTLKSHKLDCQYNAIKRCYKGAAGNGVDFSIYLRNNDENLFHMYLTCVEQESDTKTDGVMYIKKNENLYFYILIDKKVYYVISE